MARGEVDGKWVIFHLSLSFFSHCLPNGPRQNHMGPTKITPKPNKGTIQNPPPPFFPSSFSIPLKSP